MVRFLSCFFPVLGQSFGMWVRFLASIIIILFRYRPIDPRPNLHIKKISFRRRGILSFPQNG